MAREVKLLKKCLKGSSQAFEVIVEKYQELICAITFSGTADVQQSEELAHQTFVNAWKNLSQLKDLSKFRPWLCAIARNNIRDFINKSQRDIIVKAKPMENINDMATDQSGPLESAIKKEHEALVRDAIQQVPERYREPLVLYYRRQQSEKQVAISLDLSEDVVKQRLQRGRIMIKEQLSSIVEKTLSSNGPKKAFTTAVIASVAAMAIKGSGVAAAAGIAAASSSTGTATGVASVISGLTAKIITAAAVVAIGIGAVVTYKHVTKPGSGPELSQTGIVVQEQGDKQEKITEGKTGQPSDETADLSAIDESRGDLESGKSLVAPTGLAAAKNTIHLGIHVFDDKTAGPIAGAQLRVNRGCGCNCEPNYYSTDANGFYLIDFGENKPSYLSILATKAGYVPMMFVWRDNKMVENMGDEFSFSLPKGNKMGGVIENEDSKTIPSAKVIVNMNVDESREYPWVRIDDYTVTTDANGRWQCDIFPREPRQFSVKLRHPDYADTRIWVNERDYKFEDFHSMQSVLVMEKGVFLEGWVTDMAGEPIEGASVFTGEDRFDNDSPKTTTDSQGQFKFQHFLPSWTKDKIVLTVQAKGYGPELEVLPMRPDMEPVIIPLALPHTIRVRAVDVKGNPIAGAGVDVDNWRGYRSLSWRSQTDEAGRFVWNEAPADQVDIDIYKDGYMRVANQFFVARDEEYEVIMLPPLVISGSVVDADTNEPIQNFTATRGIQWRPGSLYWETPSQAGYNADFTDGRYQINIGYPYPGHLVRIDAEGYLTAKSRVFDSNEGLVTYDFRLKKGTGPTGIVYDPNGSPATGAQIYVVIPNRYLQFANGKPSNQPKDSEWAVTDKDGTFSFKGLLEDSSYKLVVIHNEGFAEVSKQQWLMDPNITLQKWGRVEGALYSGLKAAANQSVHFYSQDAQNNPEQLNYYYAINAITDDQGHFTIERVIPGRGAIARRIVSDSGRRSSYGVFKRIEIAAGQTTNVDIGGGGRLVTGRLIKPDWVTDTTDIQNTYPRISPVQTQKTNPYEIYAGLEFPMPQRFDEMTVAEVLKWYEQWIKSDKSVAFRKEIEKRIRDQGLENRNYNVIVEPDGSFRILDVLPGEYTLAGELRKADERGQPNYKESIVAEIKHTFTVGDITEENQDIPVELGTVEFFPAAKLEPNKPVPDFNVRSLNGGTLNLTDFRGKYLLLTFYMITGEESLNEDMADLKRIQDDFAGDKRFEMMGLTKGEMPLYVYLAKKFLAEQGLTWQQGFIDGSNYELIQTFKIQNWPHSLLIDPKGVLLANGLKGEKLYEAVAKALAKRDK